MDDFRAFPNITEAAALLGVSTAALSRRKPETVRFGGRELRLPPIEVMNQADYFKRRPLSQVAGDLVEHTHRRAPDLVDRVDRQLADRLAIGSTKPVAGSEFLEEARRVLPRRLFLQIRKFYSETDQVPAELGPATLLPTEAAAERHKHRRISARAGVGRAVGTQKA